MASVALILGLIGFGVYTDNTVFYWLAGTVGVFHALLQLAAIGTMKMVKSQFENADISKLTVTPARAVRTGRRRY